MRGCSACLVLWLVASVGAQLRREVVYLIRCAANLSSFTRYGYMEGRDDTDPTKSKLDIEALMTRSGFIDLMGKSIRDFQVPPCLPGSHFPDLCWAECDRRDGPGDRAADGEPEVRRQGPHRPWNLHKEEKVQMVLIGFILTERQVRPAGRPVEREGPQLPGDQVPHQEPQPGPGAPASLLQIDL